MLWDVRVTLVVVKPDASKLKVKITLDPDLHLMQFCWDLMLQALLSDSSLGSLLQWTEAMHILMVSRRSTSGFRAIRKLH